MKKKVHYICFYADQEMENRTIHFPTAIPKIKYIISALSKHFQVEVLSTCSQVETNLNIIKKNVDGVTYRYVATLYRSKNKIARKLSAGFIMFQIIYYILFKVKRDESVIVYHSMFYLYPLLITKWLKKYNLILEVEEIYQDVLTYSKNQSLLEYKIFGLADNYIFSTELLNKNLNKENKPHVIIYGTYCAEPQIISKYNDGKIHIIYAGTLEPRKGCLDSVKSALYLSSQYHIHILGFGEEKDIEILQNTIQDIQRKTDAIITYDGYIKGLEFIKSLQSCHIGLCTQDPLAKFTTTSFPSKILTYLSNGLRVVAVSIPSLLEANIHNYVNFYLDQNPKSIADAIKSIDFQQSYNSRKIVDELDKSFTLGIKELIN